MRKQKLSMVSIGFASIFKAFPIWGAVAILHCNLGNSFFQAALCGVMWGLRYTERPAVSVWGDLQMLRLEERSWLKSIRWVVCGGGLVDDSYVYGCFVLMWDCKVRERRSRKLRKVCLADFFFFLFGIARSWFGRLGNKVRNLKKWLLEWKRFYPNHRI